MELNDDQAIRFINTVTDKLSHIQPSQKTKEMFDDLNKKTDVLQKTIDSVEHKFDLNVQDFRHFQQDIASMMKNHQDQQGMVVELLRTEMKEKADKWVEPDIKRLSSSVKWITGIVLGAVVIAVLNNVLK